MKTSISISGQIGGNHTLARACGTIDSEQKRTMFNGFEIKFKTKKEAVKALSQAYQFLKSEEPEYFKQGGISYKRGYGLWYDASKAIIERTENNS